jgi:hypothetical protein
VHTHTVASLFHDTTMLSDPEEGSCHRIEFVLEPIITTAKSSGFVLSTEHNRKIKLLSDKYYQTD